MNHMMRIFVVLVLSAGLQAQEISPYLFGQNYWLADGDEERVGYLHELWPQVKASGVKSIRIGGIHYEYHFPDRSRLVDKVESIQAIGAEPILQVPRFMSAIQAKELVEFFTRNPEMKVKFWSIGNEPKHTDEKISDAEIYAYIKRIATAMKSVDPTIKIFVFDANYLREKLFKTLCGGALDLTGLKVNGYWLIDGFSFHSYPNGKSFVRDDVVFKGPNAIQSQFKTLKGLMDQADVKHQRRGNDQLIWAFTEFNVTWANPNREISGYGNPSFLGGQFMAEVFGLAMQYGAFSANQWCINEVDAVSTDFGYLGPPKEFYPRSSYYHMQMMASHMRGQFVLTKNNQQYVKTVGSKSEDGFCVLVMNQHSEQDFEFDIIMNSEGSSTKPLQINVDASLTKQFSGSISNQSTRLFVFDTKGRLVKEMEYSLQHNLQHQPPEEVK